MCVYLEKEEEEEKGRADNKRTIKAKGGNQPNFPLFSLGPFVGAGLVPLRQQLANKGQSPLFASLLPAVMSFFSRRLVIP